MKTGIKRLLTVVGMLAAIALVIGACGGGEEPAPAPTTAPPTATPARPAPTPTPVPPTPAPTPEQPKIGGTLRWGLFADPGTMDIQKFQQGADWALLYPVMNWLVQWSVEKDVIPDLAERWTVSQDGTVYTFNLTRNAKWHDGKPFVADDVVFNYQRILFSDDLKGGTTACRSLLSTVKTVEKVDDYTVRFTQTRFSPTFLPAMGVNCSVINPPHLPLANFPKRTSSTVIGTGPYKFKEYQDGVKATEVRNPEYFRKDTAGRQLPYLDGIEFFRVADATFEYSLFRTGQVDLMNPYGGDRLLGRGAAELKADVPGAIYKAASFFAVYQTFRSDAAPWNDVRVRKAISLALDREAFRAVYTKGNGPAYRGFVYPGVKWANSEDEIKTWPGYNSATKKQDIEQAKQLLKEAGVDLTAIKLSVPIYRSAEQTTEIFVSLLGQALGVQWTVGIYDTAQFRQIGQDKNFGIYSNLQSAAFTDPAASLAPWASSTGPGNVGKFSDPSIDARLDEMNATPDEAKRIQLSRAIEKDVLTEKFWYIISGNGIKNHAWHPWVKGYNGFGSASEITANTMEQVWLTR